jgi:thioredoxin-dependent peroxiredoxin
MLKVGKKIAGVGKRALEGSGRKWTVLYFYPKDDTPGCTTEACSLRDYYSEIKALGARIVGVSKDDPKSHSKFIAKYKLPFELLSDPDHELMDYFGVWQEKSLYGRKYMGTVRATFLIDPNGKIAYVWPKVTPAEHGAEIVNELRAKMA